MTIGGSVEASWSTTSGTHTMEVTEAFTHLPVVKPHCVGAQIHNAADDVITVRLEGSKLFFDQNGANGPIMTTSYHLGDRFTVKWIVRNGGVECYYNGRYFYTYPVSTSGCYFKAGCYTQSNTSKGDSATAYGEVVVYGVSVTHQ
jgi:poly(beta-D-mannuronate) lyase